jgi:hypothetical protein
MMAPAMSLLARMDRLPFSRPHYALLVIGGLGYTFDGADNALVAFLLPSMAREWGLDNGRSACWLRPARSGTWSARSSPARSETGWAGARS